MPPFFCFAFVSHSPGVQAQQVEAEEEAEAEVAAQAEEAARQFIQKEAATAATAGAWVGWLVGDGVLAGSLALGCWRDAIASDSFAWLLTHSLSQPLSHRHYRHRRHQRAQGGGEPAGAGHRARE